MNVLDMLNKELLDKNWTLEEKSYYIYLRSCQLFFYDPRYKFLQLVLSDDNLQNQIKYREINLEDVQNNLVVCSSISNQVISPLLYHLLGINSLARGSAHFLASFNDGIRLINADATIKSDIGRVKMQLNTHGCNPV